jgi:hypothetical protein
MSVFAFQVSQHCLHVLDTRVDAVQLLGIDADLEDWLFFDDAGQPLKIQHEAGATVFLRPWASCASCSLPQILHDVHQIRGIAPLDTLEGVRRHIDL